MRYGGPRASIHLIEDELPIISGLSYIVKIMRTHVEINSLAVDFPIAEQSPMEPDPREVGEKSGRREELSWRWRQDGRKGRATEEGTVISVGKRQQKCHGPRR